MSPKPTSEDYFKSVKKLPESEIINHVYYNKLPLVIFTYLLSTEGLEKLLQMEQQRLKYFQKQINGGTHNNSVLVKADKTVRKIKQEIKKRSYL